MTDRELLEMAAKAAGAIREGQRMTGDISEILIGDRWIEWNPLTDDGDALRLAVKLGLLVDLSSHESSVSKSGEYEPLVSGWITDACYRRAIVRAAAAIGGAM